MHRVPIRCMTKLQIKSKEQILVQTLAQTSSLETRGWKRTKLLVAFITDQTQETYREALEYSQVNKNLYWMLCWPKRLPTKNFISLIRLQHNHTVLSRRKTHTLLCWTFKIRLCSSRIDKPIRNQLWYFKVKTAVKGAWLLARAHCNQSAMDLFKCTQRIKPSQMKSLVNPCPKMLRLKVLLTSSSAGWAKVNPCKICIQALATGETYSVI